jgi:L-alanine-DL-glutamate epimerase-like enolase superfamily enzyme
MTIPATRIRAVDTMLVSVPMDRPIRTPIHHITTVDNVLVTVHTESGLSGFAYLWTFGPERARALAALVHDLERLLVGRDALERVSLWDSLWRDANFLGRAGAVMLAIAGLDIALWDIAGKSLGQPLWRLLGGTRRPVGAYAGGLFLSDPIDDIVAEARGFVARGFRAIKMRCGAARWTDDVARVEAVRAEIGPDITLMVDVVQGWTPDQAIRVGREIERFDLAWIEDPVAFDDIAGMARVAAALDTPIAAGENDYALRGFRELIRNGAIDIAMADLQRVGGITEWLRVAALAQAFAMPIVPHTFHETSMHLLAAIPNGGLLEYVPWWEVLLESPPVLEHGAFLPSDRPGLGYRFNEATIDRWRIG